MEQNGQKYTQTAMQVAMSELEKLDVLREVDTYLDYLDGRKDPYIVYEKGYLLLLGKKLPGGYLKLCSILAVVVMVLISARLWGEDEWCGTGMLCMGKPDRHEKDHTPEDVLELSVCTVYRDHCVCSVDLAVPGRPIPCRRGL